VFAIDLQSAFELAPAAIEESDRRAVAQSQYAQRVMSDRGRQ